MSKENPALGQCARNRFFPLPVRRMPPSDSSTQSSVPRQPDAAH